jgi:hypothetical protein
MVRNPSNRLVGNGDMVMRLLAFAFVLLASSAAMATSPGPNIRGRWCSLSDSTYYYMPADDSCKRDVLEITEQYFGFPEYQCATLNKITVTPHYRGKRGVTWGPDIRLTVFCFDDNEKCGERR